MAHYLRRYLHLENMDTKPTDKKPRIKPKANIDDLSFAGKVPPQAIELEEAVLGAMMLQKDALLTVIDLLHPEIFYSEKNRLIYEAIKELFQRNEPADLLTVSQELRKKGMLDLAGGSYNLSRITSRVASAANIEYHARIIAQKFIMRELIRFGGELIRDAYDESTDTLELLDRAQNQLFNVGETSIRRSVKGMDVVLKQTLDIIEKTKNHENTITGVPSGIDELDKVTNGWQKQDLIIVAARPAMGKTAFVLSLARNACLDYQKPVAFFSLEMSNTQIASRLLSAEAEINQEALRNGRLNQQEWGRVVHKAAHLERAPLYVDDTPALTVFELKAKARRLKQQKDIQMIIVDYLQLMRGDEQKQIGNREQEISYISRSLKTIAKELDIPVIALAQLSRAVETRGTSGSQKMPMLSDLRESGSIEQDADMVMFLYRPEYYKLDFWDDTEHQGESYPSKNLAIVSIQKHRNGRTANIKTTFDGAFTRFRNYAGDSISYDNPNGGMNVITLSSKMNNPEMDDGATIF